MEKFRDTLTSCGLCDLGFKGSWFTWNNGGDHAGFTKERLDRVLAKKEWCVIHSDVVV